MTAEALPIEGEQTWTGETGRFLLLRELVRRPSGLFGLLIVAALLILLAFGPLIAWRVLQPRIFWELTTWGAICYRA